jgi:hypothetical protein
VVDDLRQENKYYKATVGILKCFFRERYCPPKLWDGTKLQVKYLRKNMLKTKFLTEYAKGKRYFSQNT